MTAGPSHPGERAWVYWTTDGSVPQGKNGHATSGFSAPLLPTLSEWDTELWGYIRHFKGSIPGQPEGTLIRYVTSLEAVNGRETFADDGKGGAFYVADDPLPDWTRDAVIYQIFVDRFAPQPGEDWLKPETPAGFYGGKINGITAKLDYIADLGFNTLWLTPIFPSPSHHGYDATDLFTVEPRLGTLEDFQRLTHEAHKRGIRILLDFVPNHISSDHNIFRQAIADPNSPYRTWFNFTHYPDEYENFFGVKSLPQLNLSDPGARQYMLDAARFWLKQGADGFRVDYAIGPVVDFWADFRRATREIKPDCWTFGEVVDPPDVQLNFYGGLDGCLDFMLLEAMRQTLAYDRWDGEKLAAFLERHEAAYPDDFSRPSFLDNHDMNRFLWAALNEKDRLRQAALLQFALAGPPVVYYGTEVGLSQERDTRQGTRGIPEESRLPMLWGDQQDKGLVDFYRDLIHIRKQYPVLSRGRRKTLTAEKSILIFERAWEEQCLGVVLNLSGNPQLIKLPFSAKSILAATSNENCQITGGEILLPAHGGAILLI